MSILNRPLSSDAAHVCSGGRLRADVDITAARDVSHVQAGGGANALVDITATRDMADERSGLDIPPDAEFMERYGAAGVNDLQIERFPVQKVTWQARGEVRAGWIRNVFWPILLLVESGHEEILRRWTNIGGVYAPRFPSGAMALNKADEGRSTGSFGGSQSALKATEVALGRLDRSP